MRRIRQTLFRVIRGTSDANIGFNDLRVLLGVLGFEERIKGSHHIFTRKDVEEIVNVQPRGGKAKPYQVRQVRQLITKYKLSGQVHDEH